MFSELLILGMGEDLISNVVHIKAVRVPAAVITS